MVFVEKAPGPWRAGPQALGARGPKPPGDLAHRPLGLDPATLTDFLQAKLLTSCCVSNPWVRVSKRYHNPQSADLGGRWMVSEGGAVQFHERRGSRLRSSISAAGPGQVCRDLANKPLSPASRSRIPKKCPGAHRLMKSLACCTD